LQKRPHGNGVFTFSEDVIKMVPVMLTSFPAFFSLNSHQLQSGFSIRGSFDQGFVHGKLQQCAQSLAFTPFD
jgi:hypothetical protein